MPKTRTSVVGGGIRIATGIYTGDGAPTQAIVGVGFQPKFVKIQMLENYVSTGDGPGMKADIDGLNAWFWDGGMWSHRYREDMIISLDVDGFTVGDGTGFANIFNLLQVDYTYTCYG